MSHFYHLMILLQNILVRVSINSCYTYTRLLRTDADLKNIYNYDGFRTMANEKKVMA